METYSRVIKQGNSLVLPLTKELKSMAIGEGDWVRVEVIPVKKLVSQEPETKGSVSSFDPSAIGDKVLKTTSGISYESDELRMLIRTYDSDEEHVESVLKYVLNRRE